MSHFTHIKTRFQNLFYLEKALNQLKLNPKKEFSSDSSDTNLIISQSNGYDMKFVWNGEEYEFVVDMSFWEQSSPIENFIDRITQEYAGEIVIGETKKVGFQPTKYQQNTDGSNTLILERWSSNQNISKFY